MRYRSLLLLCLGFVILFSACSKDPNRVNNNYNGTGAGVLSAYINGYSWYASTGYAQLDNTQKLTLFAKYSQDNDISLYVYPYSGPGTYQLNGLNTITYYENGVTYSPINGEINITYDNTNSIQGTFSSRLISTSGSETLDFTNGQFNIPKY